MAEKPLHIYTVEELTDYIKDKLTSDDNLVNIWVKGEVSNLTKHSSGHFYFTLKDESSQITCAMFRRANQKLEFNLEDGLKVVARGSIDVYKPRGNYNLIVEELKPKGLGILYLRFEQLKKKLAKEGLFADEYKKPLPKFPRRIAVITSPTGATIQDILNIIKRRFSCVNILLIPTLVQGENAAESIVHSIGILEKVDVDVAIVGRGGGSLEDLWPFNEEIVARAIFRSKVPIISAVGHQTDFTISDFVADYRAPTPSAAAEKVVPSIDEVVKDLDNLKMRLQQDITNAIEIAKRILESISIKPTLIIGKINQYQQRTDELSTRLFTTMKHNIEIQTNRLTAIKGKLNAVSPIATFKRGYSVALKLPEKSIVDKIEKTQTGDDIEIVVIDGEIHCRVKGIKEVERWKI